jgi:hypothetical protein
VTLKEATEVNHEEFAERAERRLKEVADRLEVEGKDLRIAGEASKITARAQELRVAALLVREEALAVSKTIAPPAEEPAALADNLPLCPSKLRPSAGLMARAQRGAERHQ